MHNNSQCFPLLINPAPLAAMRVCQNSKNAQNTPKLPVGRDENVFKYSILKETFLVLTHPEQKKERQSRYRHRM